MNFFALPETRAAASAPPAALSYTPKAPTDDFALMLAESAAALRPEKPTQYKDAPRKPEPAEETDATPAAERDQPPAEPDAPPEVDDDAEGKPADDAADDNGTAQAAPAVSEAARQAIAAAAAAAASAAANTAPTPGAGLVDTAAAEGAVQAATAVAGAAALTGSALATDTALEQMALGQAGSAGPAKPAAMPATAPVSADTPVVELSASLLAAAPEPAVPGNATDVPAPAMQPTPGSVAAPRLDAKLALATGPDPGTPAQANAPAQQNVPVALAPPQETAAPGAGMIQAAVAAAIRDAAPDSRAPAASSAATDAPAVVPQAGPGHAPAAPAEHAAALPPAAAPNAPTLDNIAQYTVRSVRLMLHDGQQTLTVRLIPESLGELHLEVSSLRDSLHVRLMSANPVVRDALERQLGSLRDTLARSGVEAASVTVSSGSTAGQASHNPLTDGRNEGPSTHLGPQSASDQNPAGGHPSSRRSTAHQGLIDVLI